jgi:hypothetical protein
MSRSLALVGLTASLVSSTFAQSIPSIEGKLLGTPPTIDGVIGEDEWRDAAKVTTTFADTDTGSPLGDPVTFYLATTATSIVFAVKVIDNPKTLEDSEYRANVSLGGNDNVGLSIEPFAKGSGFSAFRVNPAGANQISIAGGRAPKAEWLGSLKSAAKITETGWQAEMSIPWALMDLPSAGSRDVMVNVVWNERNSLRGRIWHFNNGDGSKTPLWKGVSVPRVNTRPTLQLLPYVYGGAREGDSDPIINMGLDFKTSLTSKSQVVGTINPDFRNIENQVLGLDFSYFERLAGEGRPFFQEGRDYRPDGRFFASQRIRNFDAGINTYGSLDDKTNYSLLTTSDFGRQTAVVASANRNLGSSSDVGLSYVGSMERGRHNSTGVISHSRQSGSWGFFGSHGFTDDQEKGRGSSTNLGATVSGGGFFAFFGFEEVTPKFFPRLGFSPETDFRGGNLYMEWEKPHPRGPIMETEFGMGLNYLERLGGEVYRKGFNLNGSVTWRNLVDLDFGTNQETFFGNADQIHYVSLEHPRGNSYRSWSIGGSTGVLAGQKYESLDMRIGYRPIKRLQATLSAQWQSHFDESRQVIFGLNWERGLYESLGGRLIEREGKINWHLSWRRSGGFGNEFFVILGDPNALTFRRQIIVKAVFPLSVRY